MATPAETAQKLDVTVQRFNRFTAPLLRIGVPLGPMYLLTVPGRRTGAPRTTPVATFTYEGKRYIMQAYPRANWVKNARAAGSGTLGRGRRMRRVGLVEVPVDERRVLLHHVGTIAPRSLSRRFVEGGLIESTAPESFAASAPTTAVFRVEERA